jgi:hypothetical protein
LAMVPSQKKPDARDLKSFNAVVHHPRAGIQAGAQSPADVSMLRFAESV